MRARVDVSSYFSIYSKKNIILKLLKSFRSSRNSELFPLPNKSFIEFTTSRRNFPTSPLAKNTASYRSCFYAIANFVANFSECTLQSDNLHRRQIRRKKKVARVFSRQKRFQCVFFRSLTDEIQRISFIINQPKVNIWIIKNIEDVFGRVCGKISDIFFCACSSMWLIFEDSELERSSDTF